MWACFSSLVTSRLLKKCKKENELKLKEAKFKDYEKNNGKMEAKVEMLEFRNKELERTILNLQDRIDLFDTSHVYSTKKEATPRENSGSTQPGAFSNKTRCDDLIQGIHDRVSAYVLLKIEKQIESLIDLESNVNMNTSANQDTDVHVEAPVSCQSMNNASNEIFETPFPNVQIEKNESQSPVTETVNNYCHSANTQTPNQPVVFYCDRLHNSVNISPTMNNS